LNGKRYIANQSKELKVHPKKFFIGGISAGAITALNATFLDQGEPILGRGEKFDRMYGCLDCVGESSFTDYKILGVINIAGGVYDLSILDNNKVPVISFHGDADNIVPHDKGIPFESVSEYYNQFLNTLVNQAEKYNYPNLAREMQEGKVSEMIGSKQIHRHLKSKRRTSEYHEIPGGSHYLVLSDNNAFMQKGVEMVDKISKFMYRRLK
jgi:poly(3-hydroxybutyrate) depolymerase